MKFSLLKIGQRFEYQGEMYVKTTPMVANHVDSGEQKLIPRSATLSVEGAVHTPPAENHSVSLDASTVKAAYLQYQTEVDSVMEQLKPKLDEEMYTEIKNRLQQAQKIFLGKIAD